MTVTKFKLFRFCWYKISVIWCCRIPVFGTSLLRRHSYLDLNVSVNWISVMLILRYVSSFLHSLLSVFRCYRILCIWSSVLQNFRNVSVLWNFKYQVSGLQNFGDTCLKELKLQAQILYFLWINLFSSLIWNNFADNFIKSNIIYNVKLLVPPDQL